MESSEQLQERMRRERRERLRAIALEDRRVQLLAHGWIQQADGSLRVPPGAVVGPDGEVLYFRDRATG